MAAGDVLGELLQVLEALGHIAFQPRAAIDILEDHFGRDLHGYSALRVVAVAPDAADASSRKGGIGFASFGRRVGSELGRGAPLAAAEFPLIASSAREVPRSFCCCVWPGAGFALSGH